MPVLWCGKDTGREYRVGLYCEKENNDFVVAQGNWIKTEDIEHLNECLEKIGEKPVPIDIPDGIDWSKYKQKTSASPEAKPNKKQP